MGPIRRKCLQLAAFALCVVAPTLSRAGGLINHLPPDGSYVVLRAKSELDFQGNLQSFERELKVASVGKQEVDGEPGRWIELSTEFAGRRVFAKLLIAEKHLNGKENPFEHVAQAVARGPDGEVVELPKERLKQIITFALPLTHFDKLEKKDKAKVKTELGEYECDRQLGESEFDGPMESKIKISGDMWTNDKVPFGLVKAKVKGEMPFGSIETELEAIKSGTDAKSELAESK